MLADVQEDVLVLLDLEDQPIGFCDPSLEDLPANAFDFFRVQGRVERIRLEKLELLEGSGLKGRGQLPKARFKSLGGGNLHIDYSLK